MSAECADEDARVHPTGSGIHKYIQSEMSLEAVKLSSYWFIYK